MLTSLCSYIYILIRVLYFPGLDNNYSYMYVDKFGNNTMTLHIIYICDATRAIIINMALSITKDINITILTLN